MSAINVGPPTFAEGVADRMDILRIAYSEAVRLYGSGGFVPADVVQLAYFLAAGDDEGS